MFADVLASRIRIFNKGVEQLVMSRNDIGRSALTIFFGQSEKQMTDLGQVSLCNVFQVITRDVVGFSQTNRSQRVEIPC